MGATSIGFVHLLPNLVLFRLFGASLYTMRLTAVAFGVAAVPLMYWLVRRLAGCGPAVAATLLLISAPEQLFWSRNENANFIPIALLALLAVIAVKEVPLRGAEEPPRDEEPPRRDQPVGRRRPARPDNRFNSPAMR